MENQAKYTKTANIVEMDNNLSIEFYDSENNYLKLAGDEIKDISENIKKIFEKFKIPKSPEELKIEELEKENKEMLKIITKNSTDAEKIELIKSFPLWEVGKDYWSDMDIPFVVYPDYESGSLYRIINKDIVKSQSDWTPDIAVSLFTKVVPSGVILEFGKNLDDSERDLASNPYMKGEKVIEDGYIWVSTIDNNVWSPSDYPSGWKKERGV
ncbi:hypothetical protein [Helcococcus kunzii]|uniref:hypothetical protein n=1 Tax=Helcococcus kunzii TaxID=40091 RepID=UPI0038A142BA